MFPCNAPPILDPTSEPFVDFINEGLDWRLGSGKRFRISAKILGMLARVARGFRRPAIGLSRYESYIVQAGITWRSVAARPRSISTGTKPAMKKSLFDMQENRRLTVPARYQTYHNNIFGAKPGDLHESLRCRRKLDGRRYPYCFLPVKPLGASFNRPRHRPMSDTGRVRLGRRWNAQRTQGQRGDGCDIMSRNSVDAKPCLALAPDRDSNSRHS